jgi:hypothetical protein
VCIRYDNGRAFLRDSEQELGKFKRKPDTFMGIRITRQVASVQRDAAPSDALHVRHLCAFVGTRRMMHLFFQDREDTDGSTVARPSSLTLDHAMQIPFRYTYVTCSVMLATIETGASGARSGSQTYSPGLSVTVYGETRTPSVKVSIPF